jgi:radical SAM superfamily enzyme YgiQ (UPF0313 family)
MRVEGRLQEAGVAAGNDTDMKILLIYPKFPEETFWNAVRSAKVFMNCSGMMPPLGLLTVASYLPQDFEIRLIDRNVSEESDADWEWADAIFLSAMLAQRRDYETCVEKARAHGKPVAVGGPLTHAMPEKLLAHADWICFGEAESIMDELVGDLRAGRRGRSYQGGNKTNMEGVRIPRFDLVANFRDYTAMALQFSRGCPFQCEFCDIIEIYGRVPRTKTPAQVTAELDALRQQGFEGYVFMVDDNFIGNKRKAKEMLKELAVWNRRNGHPFAFFTEASINLADDRELLEAMSEAGFLRVFIGIETPDPKLLKTTLKAQNIPGDPLAKLNRIREHGIHVTAGFIVGFDGEDRGVFETQRSFIQASGIGVAIPGLLQAIPGTQLARRLQNEGRLQSDADVSLITTVEGINFVPKGEMTKREYLEGYRGLVREVFAPERYFERVAPAVLALRRIPRSTVARLLRRHFPVFIREVYHLGVRIRGSRILYWKALLRVLWKNPDALEAFGHDCFYYYHLNRHADFVDRQLAAYLSSPAPHDVLDQVIRDSGPAASPVALHVVRRTASGSSTGALLASA